MAERRMFAKTIIDSDAFLDMPVTAQCLYFHLSMRADDEGFINSPRRIARMVGATQEDLDELVRRRFLLAFPSGVVAIKHWLINNYIQNDRRKPTVYQEERAQLTIKDNRAYTKSVENQPCVQGAAAVDTECIQDGYKMDTQISIDKIRLDKTRLDKNKGGATRFIPPTVQEVKAYCMEKGYPVDAEAFVAFYESKNWFVGKNKMKNWRAATVTWAKREKKPTAKSKFATAWENLEGEYGRADHS